MQLRKMSSFKFLKVAEWQDYIVWSSIESQGSRIEGRGTVNLLLSGTVWDK